MSSVQSPIRQCHGHHSMRKLLVLALVWSLSGCAGMLLGSGPSGDRAPTTRQSGTVASADTTISQALRQQYNADAEISQFPIGIRAVSGRVVLTGTVGSYDVRDKVNDIALNTHGVVSVDSRIVVNTNL